MVSIQAGDAFAQVFDSLAKEKAGWTQLESWAEQPSYQVGKAAVRHSCTATRAGFALDETLLTDPDPAHLMGVLMGLDNLFIVAADPMYPTTDRVVLSMRLHYRRTGQFNLSEPGMVVPRRADRSRPHATADELSQVFKTLRISPEFKDSCAWVRVDELHDHIPGIPGCRSAKCHLPSKKTLRAERSRHRVGSPPTNWSRSPPCITESPWPPGRWPAPISASQLKPHWIPRE